MKENTAPRRPERVCPAGTPAAGFREVRAVFGRVPRDPSLRYALGMEPGVAIDRLRDYFGEHAEGIACVWLFGSTARGEARTGSDVDVAVLRWQAFTGLKATLDGEEAAFATIAAARAGKGAP